MTRIGAAVVLLGSLLVTSCTKNGAVEARSDAVPVVAEAAQQRALPVVIRAIATVESTGSVVIQSRVDGPIVRVFVKDGSDVKAGEPLLQIDPTPFEIALRRARAMLARDQANLDYARSKEARGVSLLAQHYIADDDYNLLKTNVAAAIATVDQDRAAVDDAELQLSYTTIKAPVAGRIGHIAQQVGNMIRASATTQTPLTTLNVLDPVDISFAIPEQQLALVVAAAAAGSPEVRVTRSADAGGEIAAKGALTFIDNAADPSTGTIRLRARFANAEHALWPGQFVTASLSLSLPVNGDSIVVSNSAISNGPDGTFVYVVVDNSIVEQRPVQVSRTTDTWAIVTGLQAGELVVVDGQSRLRPHARVTLRTTDKPT